MDEDDQEPVWMGGGVERDAGADRSDLRGALVSAGAALGGAGGRAAAFGFCLPPGAGVVMEDSQDA